MMTLTALKIKLIGINHAIGQMVETPINEHFTLTEAVEAYEYISDAYSDILEFVYEAQENHPNEISETLVDKLSDCVDNVLKAVNAMSMTNEVKALEQEFCNFVEIYSKF